MLCDAELPEDVRYKDTAIAVPKGNEDFLELINETIKECQDEGLIDPVDRGVQLYRSGAERGLIAGIKGGFPFREAFRTNQNCILCTQKG